MLLYKMPTDWKPLDEYIPWDYIYKSEGYDALYGTMVPVQDGTATANPYKFISEVGTAITSE